VQNNTSRHIHARQYTGANGNTPGKHTKKNIKLKNYIKITIEILNNINGVTIMYNTYF